MVEFDKLYQNVINELGNSLPSHLSYHSVSHTKYVLSLATYIADQEKVSAKDIRLIKTAALLHDSGFMLTQAGHEEASCEIAKKKLPLYRYNKTEINVICNMILATKIPQKPKNLMEEILADADLEYLGTDQYDTVSQNLYLEIIHSNPSLTQDEWLKIQISFLEQHTFFTSFCKENREQMKAKNLEKLKLKLGHQI
jgi:uncharacterized protein